MKQSHALEHIKEIGNYLLTELRNLIKTKRLYNCLSVEVTPLGLFLVLKTHNHTSALHLKTLFMQECLYRGVLTFGTHNLSYATQKLISKNFSVSMLKFLI